MIHEGRLMPEMKQRVLIYSEWIVSACHMAFLMLVIPRVFMKEIRKHHPFIWKNTTEYFIILNGSTVAEGDKQ